MHQTQFLLLQKPKIKINIINKNFQIDDNNENLQNHISLQQFSNQIKHHPTFKKNSKYFIIVSHSHAQKKKKEVKKHNANKSKKEYNISKHLFF